MHTLYRCAIARKALLPILLSLSVSIASGQSWRPSNVGMHGAYFSQLRFAPDGTPYMFTNKILTPEGIYRFVRSESRWELINRDIVALDVDWIAGDTMIVANYDNRAYRSEDGGRTWSGVLNNLTTGTFAITPDGTIYAVANNLLTRSTDRGRTWTQARTKVPAPHGLGIDGRGRVIIAVYDFGTYRTTDDGESWTLDTTTIPRYIGGAVGRFPDGIIVGHDALGIFHVHDGDTVKTRVSDFTIETGVITATGLMLGTHTGQDSGLYISGDSGRTWKFVCPTVFRRLSAAPDGTLWGALDDNELVMLRSTDNGTNWTQASDGIVTPSIGSITTDGAGGVYAMTEGGYGIANFRLYASTDDGISWSQMPRVFRNGFIRVNDGGVFTADTTLLQSTDGGMSWRSIQGGHVSVDVVANGRGAVCAVTEQMEPGSGIMSTTFTVSTDNGRSWDAPHTVAGTEYQLGAMTPKGDLLAVFTQTPVPGHAASALYRSTDHGASWSVLLDSIAVNALASAPNGSVFLFAFIGDDRYTLRSTDDGLSWTRSSTGLLISRFVFGPEGIVIADVGIGPSQYISRDAGLTWTRLPLMGGGTLGAITPDRNGSIFGLVGTPNNTVYHSTDYGQSWYVYNTGIPHDNVVGLTMLSSGTLLAATRGDGIFRTDALSDVRRAPAEASSDAIEDVLPDPFRTTVTASFSLARSGHVTMTLHDLRGIEVRRIVDGAMAAGIHRITIDRDGLTAGSYLLRITTGRGTSTRLLIAE